jgi:hypothetical protein
VQEIFSAQQFEYDEPAWAAMSGKVLEDESGKVQIALLARPTVEMYALVDSGKWAAPGMKITQFERLDDAVRVDLSQQGYTDQHCWIPPVCRGFMRRLQKYFGWVKSDGPEGWTGLTRGV